MPKPPAQSPSPSPPNWIKLCYELLYPMIGGEPRTDKSPLERLAKQRAGHDHPGLADEAVTRVFEALTDDNCARCRDYTGQGKPEAYLFTIAKHLLEGFFRERFGRPRPPAWVDRDGPQAREIWERLCLKRQLEETVLDAMTASGCERAWVQGIIAKIQQDPWCQRSLREIEEPYRQDEDGNLRPATEDMQSEREPEGDLNRSEYQTLVLFMEYILSAPAEIAACEAQVLRALDAFAQRKPAFAKIKDLKSGLDDEQCVILRMYFEDGYSYAQIAARLGLEAHQPARIVKPVYEQLRAAISCDPEDIRDLLRRAPERHSSPLAPMGERKRKRSK